MLRALFLALRQLADPRVIGLLLKSVGFALVAFVVLGTAGWFAFDWALAYAGFADESFAGAGGVRGALSIIGVVIAAWLLWRIVAMAALQFFADDVVKAVEAKFYPAQAAQARDLGPARELRRGMKGAGRALLFNLLALPVALVLLVTGVGTAAVFWLVNAVLLGRELMEMVAARHEREIGASPLGGGERFAMGGIISALFIVPGVNFLAPFLGAAMATHLVHGKTA
ncbi:EI24 domain-containing protein [Pseudoblastomonas halimionae]|uniref:Cysteine biosynthesis protein CysZ n=1 Tax=Alteriqipengyuania halimionae TaxID=1926630 RepID=A0A6I4U8I7_9SPHN|nr:EI24 domain-containing protein [Alteriqipengyuania halimionae]MXP10792.1 hypothetical protein [Alteriqipengyuania halimionae]